MIANFGGTFLYSENPEKLAIWYQTNLGIEYEFSKEYEAYFITFKYLDENEKAHRYTCFSIMKSENRPIYPEQLFTINFRVYNMEKMIERLEQNGIAFSIPEIPGQGKYARLKDPENNHIELWEDQQIQKQ